MVRVTGRTTLLGVIGYPIGHSLSPLMHNAALSQMQLDWVYLPFAIAPEKLSTAIAGLEAIGVRGFSVTIPHKQAMMPLLSKITDVAQAIGAVNTVWRSEDGWHGTNTDVTGFLAPLQAMGKDWSASKAVILGNGGAARAVVAGCSQLGYKEIHVIGRNPEKLADFAQSWKGSPFAQTLQVHSWEQVAELVSDADLVVNSTPIGMSPKVEDSPLSIDVQFKSGAIAYDLIYSPSPTRFLQHAIDQGCRAIDGSEMLVQQGAAALEIWTQQSVPVDTMRQALRQHLGLG